MAKNNLPENRLTPIPLRASRKKAEPKPLTFPQPNRTINVAPPLQGVELRNYIADCIASTIYKALDMPDIEIIDMGEEQFKAFCRSVLEDAE